ncbi:RNA polymerase sigma-70 factor (ECF subfamily) [Chryseobacterium ginsenosidimutans]|uniref:RNA polymerase sigma factor n=1 Tax=Chryseobacterium ginsenosidimutans TaxID=687846 RepID=UPI0021686AEE|nr:sigma-70 family RNA polymerase sigma factor [Chryseobacterium ginsenosidimutans]MCS3870271.1 RNA polymerase sigma-70 factor (ECF subfamily) [Chryseobacterium ginsenosidimutans]
MDQFKNLYTDYKHKVYFFVKKYISNNEDIEDVVQEIFIHLWKHIKDLRNSENVEAIIFKTAKQEIANFYRKNKMILASSNDESVLENHAEEIPENIISDQDISTLQSLLEKVPAKSRDLFLQNKVQNLSYSKIAEQNNLSKSAVEKHINKVLKFLKTNFQQFIFSIIFLYFI